MPDEAASELGPAVEIRIPATSKAGLYRLSWDEGPLGTQFDLFAANPDFRESSLERIGQEDLKTMLAPLDVDITAVRGEDLDSLSPTGREAWRSMAWGLLALLIVEPLLTTWVGRSR